MRLVEFEVKKLYQFNRNSILKKCTMSNGYQIWFTTMKHISKNTSSNNKEIDINVMKTRFRIEIRTWWELKICLIRVSIIFKNESIITWCKIEWEWGIMGRRWTWIGKWQWFACNFCFQAATIVKLDAALNIEAIRIHWIGSVNVSAKAATKMQQKRPNRSRANQLFCSCSCLFIPASGSMCFPNDPHEALFVNDGIFSKHYKLWFDISFVSKSTIDWLNPNWLSYL